MNQNLRFEEKLIFRNVKRAAIVWLLLIRLDPKPVNETLAAECLMIDQETARKYLRTLHESEIITRLGRFEGYQLTAEGRQLSLPFQMGKLAEANAGIPRSESHKSLKDSTTTKNLKSLKTLIVVVKALKALIKSERGKTALERGISALEDSERGNSALADLEATVKTILKLENERGNSALDEPGPQAVPITEIIDSLLADNPEKQPILDELLDCHIGMNWKTIALLFSDELTAQEIRSQYDFLNKKGKGNQTGILITNLLAKYKPRGEAYDPDTGHPLECNCYKCIGARNERTLAQWTDPEQLQKYQEWED